MGKQLENSQDQRCEIFKVLFLYEPAHIVEFSNLQVCFFVFFTFLEKQKYKIIIKNPNIICRESSKSKRQNKEKKERNETQPNSFFHINKHHTVQFNISWCSQYKLFVLVNCCQFYMICWNGAMSFFHYEKKLYLQFF